MHKFRLAALFYGPSLVSGLVVGTLAFLILAAANFSYLLRSGLLYDAIFGKGTPYDLIQSSRDNAGVINEAVLGNPLFNKVLFFAFWMLVGFMVYALLSSLSQTINETEQKLKSLRYVHASQAQIKRDIVLRLSLRAIGLISGIIYFWVFIRLILPFCIFATRIGLGNLSSVSGWLYLLLGYAVLLMALHAFVIILRLIVLRPRVYGDWNNLI